VQAYSCDPHLNQHHNSIWLNLPAADSDSITYHHRPLDGIIMSEVVSHSMGDPVWACTAMTL